MIAFDTTNASGWGHGSGLARVSRRLLAALGDRARAVSFGATAGLGPDDWFLTPELFSEEERPGIGDFLRSRRCRTAAIFHDAIPLRHPEITWPASVRRHPGYMELLSRFDRVWAVSEASRRELEGYWAWMGLARTPPVEVLHLGADGLLPERPAPAPVHAGRARIVCVGILEPRKNQSVLLDGFELLEGQGVELELHLAGRVNPHFGRPIEGRVKALAARTSRVFHHEGLDDAALCELVRSARATAFPSIAEGCGLPLLESLWLGVPCLASSVASLVENAAGGGCEVVTQADAGAWAAAMRRMATDPAYRDRLAAQAGARPLPTWAQAADTLASALGP